MICHRMDIDFWLQLLPFRKSVPTVYKLIFLPFLKSVSDAIIREFDEYLYFR